LFLILVEPFYLDLLLKGIYFYLFTYFLKPFFYLDRRIFCFYYWKGDLLKFWLDLPLWVLLGMQQVLFFSLLRCSFASNYFFKLILNWIAFFLLFCPCIIWIICSLLIFNVFITYKNRKSMESFRYKSGNTLFSFTSNFRKSISISECKEEYTNSYNK
jgi:hypothetical protein